MNILKNSIIVGEESLKDTKYETIDKPTIVNKSYFESFPSTSWWKPSINGKKRIMLCGTYPIGTSNGYSKVVYYISKHLGAHDDVELTVYGFQNFANTLGAAIRKDIPSTVKIHDAYATENPKRTGFGELEIAGYLKQNPQDIIIIFNDNVLDGRLNYSKLGASFINI
jgi:hypothetical protein